MESHNFLKLDLNKITGPVFFYNSVTKKQST